MPHDSHVETGKMPVSFSPSQVKQRPANDSREIFHENQVSAATAMDAEKTAVLSTLQNSRKGILACSRPQKTESRPSFSLSSCSEHPS